MSHTRTSNPNKMKKLLHALMIGLIPLSLFAQSNDALPKSWAFTCDREGIIELKNNPENYRELTSVELDGYGKKSIWKKLLNQLSMLPNLEEVTFVSNGFVEIPKGLNKLKNIKCLSFKDHESLDLKQLCDELIAFESLTDLSLEVNDFRNIPSNISQLKQVSLIHFTNTELDVEDETKLQVFKIPVRENGKTIRNIEATFLSYKIDPDDENNRTVGQYKIPNESRTIAETPILFAKTWNTFESPVPGSDVSRVYYSSPTERCDTLIYRRSGTRMIIPDNAFLDKSGQPVNGDVLIDYREFRDPLDFIVSGIPMSFQQEDGTPVFFSSAGMLEINASQNGEEIFLAPGKNIQVDFVSTDSSETYDFFTYNDTSGSWDQVDSAPLSRPRQLNTMPYTKAVGQYLALMNGYFDNQDTVRFDNRFNQHSHRYLQKKGNGKWETGAHFGRTAISVDKTMRVRRIRKTREGEVVFTIETNSQLHPEMQLFSTFEWRSDEPLSAKETRSILGAKTKFNDIRVKAEGSGVTFTFKGNSKFTEFSATPVIKQKKEKGYEYVPQKVKIKEYNKRLNHRRMRINKPITKYFKQKTKIELKKKRRNWANLEFFMTANEAAMSFDSFDAYANACKADYVKIQDSSAATQDQFMRTLSLTVMGLHNCDVLRTLESPKSVLATYKDENNNPIKSVGTFVVMPSVNSIIAYGNTIEQGAQRLQLDKSMNSTIIVISDDGKYLSLGNKELMSQLEDSNLKCTFTLTQVGTTESTLSEIRSAVGLNGTSN